MGGLPGFVFNLDCGKLLPAPAASATTVTAAIATVPTATASAPATATWPSTTSTAGSPATTTAVSTAPSAASTAAGTSTASAATFTRRTRFVDDNVAAHEIVAVQSLHGAVGFFVVIDLDKSEPARLPRETVAHQRDICRGDSRLSK